MPNESQTGRDIRIEARLLDPREAARYLGLATDTVYKRARLRKLPFVKIGRALRFDVLALDRFIDEHAISIRKSGNR